MKPTRNLISATLLATILAMAGCACNQLYAMIDDARLKHTQAQACSLMTDQLNALARKAEAKNLRLHINNTVNHCEILAPPNDDKGLLLMTVTASDNDGVRQQGVVVKFLFEDKEWIPVELAQIYAIQLSGGEPEAVPQADQGMSL